MTKGTRRSSGRDATTGTGPAPGAAPPAEPPPAAPVIDLMAFADWMAASAANTQESAAADPERSFVAFRLDREEFAVPIESVREVLRVEVVARVPQAPPHVRGVANVRGRILPVVEIRTRVGLKPLVPNDASRIVVLEVAGRGLGLLVDGNVRVVKVTASSLEPPPAEVVSARTDYVVGVAKRPDGLLILLDPSRTLVVKI